MWFLMLAATPGLADGFESVRQTDCGRLNEDTISLIEDIRYDGTEGEPYNLREDPMQWRNLWDDPAYAKLKSDLRADLYDNLPPERNPKLPVEPPA